MGRKLLFIGLGVFLSLSFGACGSQKKSEENAEDAKIQVESEVAEENQTEEAEELPKYEPNLPTGIEEADIFVEKIDGISDDFIRGVDISSVISLENSGVVFYNEEGEPQDIFQTLRDSGVNYIRVRIWNNPFDENGNGYGGGNCDTETAVLIGQRAAEYGLKLLVNYHYSDFWADPAKQKAPKEWEMMTLEEKEQAIYSFTKESLTEIIDAGADVGMVQIGNETNNGMAGETKKSSIAKLMFQASKAIREVGTEKNSIIKIAVHLTNEIGRAHV